MASRPLATHTSMLFLVMSGFKEGHAFLCLRKLDLGVWSLGLYVLVVAGAIFLNKQDTINSLSRLRTGLGAQLYVLYSSFLILQKEKTVRLLIAAMAIGYCLLVAKTLYLVVRFGLLAQACFSGFSCPKVFSWLRNYHSFLSPRAIWLLGHVPSKAYMAACWVWGRCAGSCARNIL